MNTMLINLSQQFSVELILWEGFKPTHYQALYHHLREPVHHFESLYLRSIRSTFIFFSSSPPLIQQDSSDTFDDAHFFV